MEECEICGSRMSDVYAVDVEGVELRVCTKCARGRKVLYAASESRATHMPAAYAKRRPSGKEHRVVDDYGSRMRKAREAMNLPMKVLAEMINEKETLLLRVEQEKTIPAVGLSAKLERALGIKLEEAQEGDTEEKRGGGPRAEEATLGEFVRRRRP